MTAVLPLPRPPGGQGRRWPRQPGQPGQHRQPRRPVRAGSGRAGERGSATAELAVCLPALVAVAVLLAGLVSTVLTQVRCVDAAAAAARVAARGEGLERAVAQGRALAPEGAVVEVTISGVSVVVRVTSPVDGLLAAALPGPGTVTAGASADLEPVARGSAAAVPTR